MTEIRTDGTTVVKWAGCPRRVDTSTVGRAKLSAVAYDRNNAHDVVINAEMIAEFGRTQVEAPSSIPPDLTPSVPHHIPTPSHLSDSNIPTADPGGLQAFDTLGNYQLLKPLGGGGMAQVYLARLRLGGQVDKLVALKTVLPEFGPNTKYGSLFLDEARFSATFQHANVVQVFDYGEAGGRPFMAMEFVHGRTLSGMLQRRVSAGRAPRVDAALAIAIEVCRALEYVHARTGIDGAPLNLVHRDVTPSNVMLSPQGEVKLLDFGIAAADGSDFGSKKAVGKFSYMCLEQARGDAPSPSWDVFSVAVMLYEMLTLKRFCKVNSTEELVAFAQKKQPSKPSTYTPTIPPELDQLVAQATSFDAKVRYASAAELHRALVAVRDRLGGCDLKAFVNEMFGDEFKHEEHAIQQLVLEGRARHTIPPSGRQKWWRRPSSLAFAAIGAAVVLLGAGYALKAPPALVNAIAPGGTLKHAQPVLPSQVTLTLGSSPVGATVLRQDTGQVLGVTPLTVNFERADTELPLQISHDGYAPLGKQVRLSNDITVEVTLAPLDNGSARANLPSSKKKKKKVVRDGFVDPFSQ